MPNFKKLGLTAALGFSIVTTSLADILQVSDFSALSAQIDTLTKQDLMVFDVDNVLIQASDGIFHPHHKRQLKNYYNNLQRKYSHAQYIQLLSIISRDANIQLVDPKVLQLFTKLKKQAVPTIALTNAGTGRFGVIAEVTNWRINQLHSVGITFDALNTYKNRTYPHLKGKHGIAIFKSGILFTGFNNKGLILLNFLQSHALKPKRIMFIDDKLKNLQDVQNSLASTDIAFAGFEYQAVFAQPKPPLQPRVTEFQFQALEHQHAWLSDAAAAQRSGIAQP